MTITEAQSFLENFLGAKTGNFYLLEQSGSARRNFIGTKDDHKYVVTYNENLAENEAFFYFSSLFSELDLNTPKILKISEDRKLYIQQFVGKETLSEIIAAEGQTDRVEKLVKSALFRLAETQKKTQNAVNFSKTFEYKEYGELAITNDLFYFKSFVADVLELPYHKSSLLQEFKNLIQKIEKLEPRGIMIRDFQARNIMVNERDEVFFIDYQSAMEGPLMYDVISFLFQAKANFSAEFKAKMLEYYYLLWDDEVKKSQLKNSLEYLQLIRFLQVLGAYGFRGLIQRKSHFMESLNQGISNLQNFSKSWQEMHKYPELLKLIRSLKAPETQLKIKNMLSKA
ncbi:Phosphotransferase enzyme family protein [Kaistella treverensis]|uniref:Phosphotransferase enzyme family protein n=1 Tax=Kaistella treverensis TaxID=631455 RepID=A0A1I3M802_9FLAO|nr:phosphotransferase [Kaistella treverensis]SFI93098.1 Phosphotransferase enzyme family protein [Kaistella treverensis]